MNDQQAEALANEISDSFPSDRPNVGTRYAFARRLARWDYLTARRAVDALIDASRRHPTVFDLREAYVAAGGDLPDAGRNMSPPVDRPRDLDPAERAEVAAIRSQVRAKLRSLFDTRSNGAYRREPDDGTEVGR